MALSDLVARLQEPRLVSFVTCWHQARGSRAVPRWRDLDPGLLRHVMPYAWSWEYDRATDEFTGKLAGEQLLDVMGRGFRGAKGHEYFKAGEADLVLGRHRRVILERLGMVTTGLVFATSGSGATGQRVALPVASRSEGEADTVLGVTLFAFGVAPGRGVPVGVTNHAPEFFTLEGGFSAAG
jgi:hypothetical protein